MSKDEQRNAFAFHYHECREQLKVNTVEAARALSPQQRARIAMPSPPRAPMNNDGTGGDYIEHLQLDYLNYLDSFDTTHSQNQQSTNALPADRELVRRVITPMAEPTWTPGPRGADGRPVPFYGSHINEARTAFKELSKDKAKSKQYHWPEIGQRATDLYKKGRKPEDYKIRVASVHSPVFHKLKGSGQHEGVTTDLRGFIAGREDPDMRKALAEARADVRTSTALTFLRSHVASSSSSSSSSSSNSRALSTRPPPGALIGNSSSSASSSTPSNRWNQTNEGCRAVRRRGRRRPRRRCSSAERELSWNYELLGGRGVYRRSGSVSSTVMPVVLPFGLHSPHASGGMFVASRARCVSIMAAGPARRTRRKDVPSSDDERVAVDRPLMWGREERYRRVNNWPDNGHRGSTRIGPRRAEGTLTHKCSRRRLVESQKLKPLHGTVFEDC